MLTPVANLLFKNGGERKTSIQRVFRITSPLSPRYLCDMKLGTKHISLINLCKVC